MNNRAEIYKSKVNMNNNSSPRVMEINYMSDSPTVLDVGCACGDLGVALKEYKNATVFGMEYNQDSIDIALKTNAYEEIHQINLDELKIDDYKQYKNKFDYIVCGDVLEHLRYPMNTLNILKNYLKEDGYIIASIPNVAHNELLQELTNTTSQKLDSLSKNINDMQNVFAKKSDLDKIYNKIRNEKDLQNEIESLNKKIEKLKQRRLYYKILLYGVIFVFLMYLILK